MFIYEKNLNFYKNPRRPFPAPKGSRAVMRVTEYNRQAAVAYAEAWAMERNPAYLNFKGIGGDCTNFVSQSIYAGAGVMNYTRDLGWYYISANDRAAAWTGVRYLYNFLTTNKGVGPFGREVSREEVMPGDVVQLGHADGTFYHTSMVLGVENGEIYVAAHTIDSLWRPLSTYEYDLIRFIHIEGVRRA